MTLTDSQVKETQLQEELEAAKRQRNKTTNELHQAIGKQNNAYSTVIGNLEDISEISGSKFLLQKRRSLGKGNEHPLISRKLSVLLKILLQNLSKEPIFLIIDQFHTFTIRKLACLDDLISKGRKIPQKIFILVQSS